MEDGIGKQLGFDFWQTLGNTRVVADAAGTAFTPWQAANAIEPAPGRADAQIKGRSGARPLDAKVPAGKAAGSGTPYASAGGAKSKGKAQIAPDRYGNRLVVVTRFRS